MYNYPNYDLSSSDYDWNAILRKVIYFFWDKTNEDSEDWKSWVENSERLYLMIGHKWGCSDVHEFMYKLWNYLEYK